MTFSLSNNKSILTLSTSDGNELILFVSKHISSEEMHYASLNQIPSWSPSGRELIKTQNLNGGWKISINGKETWRKWWLKFKSNAMILPTREGEFISNLKKVKNYFIYSLSYPGTASSKCVVIFTGGKSGFVVGAKPDLRWAKISLTRIEDYFILQLLQEDNNVYILPFTDGWQEGVKKFRKIVFTNLQVQTTHKILNHPRFLLQMGVRDFFGKTHIKSFMDLLPFISAYRNSLGEGNIVHLFGTNRRGFDRYFPDFDIDEKLGGAQTLKILVNEIHKLGLLASHHFNPRIADARWIEKNKKYKSAVVMNPSGNPWIEFYKNNIYFVMNPNDREWLDYCLETIRYFKNIGFDYIELDQIAYQRNLYTEDKGFGPGYQKLIDLTEKENIKFWLEGVSDIYKLPPDCYFQVLPRDRSQFWETNENRRGYPYGSALTLFYRTLMPEAPISYQIVTEKARVELISKRLRLAKMLNAQVYDLELGFVDKTYPVRLDKTLNKISAYLKNEN